MAMRELVTGGAPCAPNDGASTSSNPLAGFADTLLGSSSKAQEQLYELPGLHRPEGPMLGGGAGTSASAMAAAFAQEQAMPIPGLPPMMNQGHSMADADADAFLRELQARGGAGPSMAEQQRHFEAAFHEARPGPAFVPPGAGGRGQWADEFHGSYDAHPMTANPRSYMAPGHPQERALTSSLRSFLHAARSQSELSPPMILDLGLAARDKQRIRDRTAILARHVWADQGEGFADQQVGRLLAALRINIDTVDAEVAVEMAVPSEPPGVADFAAAARDANLAGLTGQMGQLGVGAGPGGQWAEDFARDAPPPGRALSTGWAEDFVGARPREGPAGWAEDFAEGGGLHADSTSDAAARRAGAGTSGAGVQSHTAALAETLASDPNPKFQNSQFLKFVSKMSRGELVMEDNGVKEMAGGAGGVGASWANEFEAEGGAAWAEQFHAGGGAGLGLAGQGWADQFGNTRGPGEGEWADQFARDVARGMSGDLEESAQWAQQFADGGFAEADGGAEAWASAFANAVPRAPEYMWAADNPYTDHANPLEEGRRLFREGVLSEAVLALEAAVQRDPMSCEGWRMLGMVHAENDDDRQAIAAMMRARGADPSNLEVLLSLGVSHTNELDREEALSHLRSWMSHHPQYRELEARFAGEPAGDVAQQQGLAVRMFQAAAALQPGDADVHTVLGVLYNLTRQFDAAEGAFKRALELRPRDYSLWNKLGATQANSSKSEEAVEAYRRALDVKPNYVRAWSNLGISYANQGRYEESAAYYVRALTMNPRAANVWSYLRIALGCSGRVDLVQHTDSRNLDALAKEFTL